MCLKIIVEVNCDYQSFTTKSQFVKKIDEEACYTAATNLNITQKDLTQYYYHPLYEFQRQCC